MKKPFSLTYVEYEEGDLFGFFLCLFSLLPNFLIVMYVTLICSQRNLHTVFALIGQLLNEGVNYILKYHMFSQKRPVGTDRQDPGMPSNHSQFIFFFCSYWIFYFFSEPRFQERIYTWLMIIAIAAGSMITCYSRLYLGYHTFEQVAAGIVFGVVCGITWRLAYNYVFAHRLKCWQHNTLCQYVYLRDTSHIPNLLAYSYSKESSKLE